MDHERFRDWFSHVDDLTAPQRAEVAAALSERPQGAASLAAIELGVDDERRCPHCGSGGAVSRGKGARSAPLSVLREDIRRAHRHGAVGSEGALAVVRRVVGRRGDDTRVCRALRDCAEHGASLGATASWRRSGKGRTGLSGIVEADETFVLESRKGGSGSWTAKPRRRGGKARKRGLSREQVPILVAADRTGATLSHTLPALNADSVREALEPVIARDALLVSDANRCYPPRRSGARHPSREHQPLPPASVCAAPCTSRRSTAATARCKGFLRGFRGIATKYLDSYLRWFHLIELGDQPSPRACLEAAMARPCLRSAN